MAAESSLLFVSDQSAHKWSTGKQQEFGLFRSRVIKNTSSRPALLQVRNCSLRNGVAVFADAECMDLYIKARDLKTVFTSTWFITCKYSEQNTSQSLQTNVQQCYIWQHCMFHVSLPPPPPSFLISFFQAQLHVIGASFSSQLYWRTLILRSWTWSSFWSAWSRKPMGNDISWSPATTQTAYVPNASQKRYYRVNSLGLKLLPRQLLTFPQTQDTRSKTTTRARAINNRYDLKPLLISSRPWNLTFANYSWQRVVKCTTAINKQGQLKASLKNLHQSKDRTSESCKSSVWVQELNEDVNSNESRVCTAHTVFALFIGWHALSGIFLTGK
jgi:hypothetical protein